MKILILNAGSSSLKYSLFDMAAGHTVLLSGLIERIGEADAGHRYRIGASDPLQQPLSCDHHRDALQALFALLTETVLPDLSELAAVGHRVVHGGEFFREPALIERQVIAHIEAAIPLAPLHNPANLLGIEETLRLLPTVPQIAVFDTAFHQTLPDYAFRYPLPGRLYTEHGVRRYGFHGTSHAYVAKQAAKHLGKPLAETNLITLHLGNGASVAAIAGGVSIDTSMGMTPLEGLMMGSRCGDIDPAIAFYLARTLGMELDAIDKLYNKASGCLGVCGENDMRAIHAKAEQGDDSARLALAMYAYRIKKYIGAYYAVLGRLDALVFTGGIGENDAWLRQTCCVGLTALGIAVDPAQNAAPAKPAATISPPGAEVAVTVIATNEELEIATQTAECLTRGASTAGDAAKSPCSAAPITE
ncbi:acetate kinase [Methylomonas sp. SURF-1]|uniref:Acetate kinase n=1 Tax=Methylomonas aurea TaxID=2952224 RepID=A0ABT1UE85_9GAMM|nr:acetate kinase [Methylomonas sp. SURF-1]MCQ8180542.1 acetate kinase [Methylomonas sp. SURF-1]